jgi:hypothetical protein
LREEVSGVVAQLKNGVEALIVLGSAIGFCRYGIKHREWVDSSGMVSPAD